MGGLHQVVVRTLSAGLRGQKYTCSTRRRSMLSQQQIAMPLKDEKDLKRVR